MSVIYEYRPPDPDESGDEGGLIVSHAISANGDNLWDTLDKAEQARLHDLAWLDVYEVNGIKSAQRSPKNPNWWPGVWLGKK